MIVKTVSPEKKRAAIIAAVMGYIRTEEDTAAVVMASSKASSQMAAPVQAAPQAPMKLWGFSGRQDQMRNMNLMQMRAFR